MKKSAQGGRNFSQCDSLLIGNACQARRSYSVKTTAKVEHEAATSRIRRIGYSFVSGRDRPEEAVSSSSPGFVGCFSKDADGIRRSDQLMAVSLEERSANKSEIVTGLLDDLHVAVEEASRGLNLESNPAKCTPSWAGGGGKSACVVLSVAPALR